MGHRRGVAHGSRPCLIARWDYIAGLFGAEDELPGHSSRRRIARAYRRSPFPSDEGGCRRCLLTAINARRVLEVRQRSAGYSAICMARALPPGGRLLSIEIEEKHAVFARRYVARAALSERIEIRVGRASTILPSLDGERFDAVFLDADKGPLAHLLQWALRLVRPGGLIIGDNALWGGRVYVERGVGRRDARGAASSIGEWRPIRACSWDHRFRRTMESPSPWFVKGMGDGEGRRGTADAVRSSSPIRHPPSPISRALQRQLAALVPGARLPGAGGRGARRSKAFSSAVDLPRLIRAAEHRGGLLRALTVPSGPDVRIFRVSRRHAGEPRARPPNALPVIYGRVAAVIRERKNRRLTTWKHEVVSRVYAPRAPLITRLTTR